MDIFGIFDGVQTSIENSMQSVFDYLDFIAYNIEDTYNKVNLLLDLGLGYVIISGILLIALLAVTVSTKNTVKELQKELREIKGEDTQPAPKTEQ